jgi:hypothetical protein
MDRKQGKRSKAAPSYLCECCGEPLTEPVTSYTGSLADFVPGDCLRGCGNGQEEQFDAYLARKSREDS